MLASAGRRAPIRPAAPARAPDPARAQAPPVDALRWECQCGSCFALRIKGSCRSVCSTRMRVPAPAGPRAAPALLLAGARLEGAERGGERADCRGQTSIGYMRWRWRHAATGPSNGRRRRRQRRRRRRRRQRRRRLRPRGGFRPADPAAVKRAAATMAAAAATTTTTMALLPWGGDHRPLPPARRPGCWPVNRAAATAATAATATVAAATAAGAAAGA
jgi:hypothetical protein